MAHLVAQGPEPHQRWRRKLTPFAAQTVGRAAGSWSTPWDELISRKHFEIRLENSRAKVVVSPDARNPVFYHGRRQTTFELRPGEHFVIGGTTFSLVDDPVQMSLDSPAPVDERTFAPHELVQAPYQRANERIDALSRLPEIIADSPTENELLIRLVNLLLVGVPQATASAVVALRDGQVEVPHWDRRAIAAGQFRPSEKLIRQAIGGEQTVVHVWNTAGPTGAEFTLGDGVDWAFCVPIPGDKVQSWALYVTGRFADFEQRGAAALRDDLKFAGLVATTFGSMRESQRLARRQAALTRFFSAPVLEAIGGEDPDVVLAPREVDVTVLFCDLRGFSRQSERMAGRLAELLERISRRLGVMTAAILAEGGVIGDFHGDAAMGFWGWPLPQEDAALRACRAALAIRRDFLRGEVEDSAPDLPFGIGIATGRAVAGKIGTVDQVKVTAFGPVVNVASRLEGLTKLLRAPILLDGPTAAALRPGLSAEIGRVRKVAAIRPAGMDAAVQVAELLPPETELPILRDEHLAAYEAALDPLHAGDWETAFQRLHHVPAADRVKDFLAMLILRHNRRPPPGWAGVIGMEEK